MSSTGKPSLRRGESVPDYLQRSPDHAFERWAVKDKVRPEGLRRFVENLSESAFLQDIKAREGWIKYQLTKIKSLLGGEMESINKDDFTNKVLKYASSLNLFRKEDRKRVAVLGAGAFGIAMAVALSGGHHNVRLLITSSRKTLEELKEIADYINTNHRYPTRNDREKKIANQLDPDYRFPLNMRAVVHAEEALENAEYVVSAIPVQGTYDAMLKYKDLIPIGVPVITVSKGICSKKYKKLSLKEQATRVGRKEDLSSYTDLEPTYMCTMDEAINLALGEGRNPVVALAGPSFAKFLAKQEQTAVTIACEDETVARRVSKIFSTPVFKLFYTTDIVGAELSGALKNVVAITAGICQGCPKFNVPKGTEKKLAKCQSKIQELATLGLITAEKAKELSNQLDVQDIIVKERRAEQIQKKGGSGLDMGPNATHLLLTRAWEDVRKLCVKKGARDETLLSLSGLGDLMLTCFGGESRNCKFGGILGMGALEGDMIETPSRENPTFRYVLDNPDFYPVCEGYYTSLALKDIATKEEMELPVLDKVCDVLLGNMDPRDLLATIMTDPVCPEFDKKYFDKKVVVPANPMNRPEAVQMRKQLISRILKNQNLNYKPSEKGGPSSIALVMIEFQNEFTTPNGRLHEAVKECMDETGMLQNSIELVSLAREKGCKIIHCPILFNVEGGDNPQPHLGVLEGINDGKLFQQDSWEADFCEGMKPRLDLGDLILQGKKGLDSFPNTNLEELLHTNGIETIVIGGFLTSCCVESTMRSGYEKGYNVITLTDCTADTSLKQYKAAVDGDQCTFKLFSRRMTSKEFANEYLS